MYTEKYKSSKQSFHVAVSASLANEMPPLQPLPREDHEPCANDKSIRSPASGLKIITAASKRASSAPRVQPLEHYVPKVVWENRFDMSAKYTNNIKSTERAGSASNVVISMGSGHVAFRLAGFKIPRDRLLRRVFGKQLSLSHAHCLCILTCFLEQGARFCFPPSPKSY